MLVAGGGGAPARVRGRGARTLVLSLWKVLDRETCGLMVDFYRRLVDGAAPADALRKAQLALKARRPEAYWWGAFICQGDLSASYAMTE